MKKVFFILLLLTGFSAFSKDENASNLSKYIGASFGMSTGSGLSYRYWPGDFGGQIVFTPVTDGTDIDIYLGTAAFLSLHNAKYTRLFFYLAANGGLYLPDTSFSFATGFGPGLEVFIFENIAFDIMFGYGFNGGQLAFTVETALHYRF